MLPLIYFAKFYQKTYKANSDNLRHIITEDLRIIGNNKLRKLFSKGPKQRYTHNITLEKGQSTITEGLKNCIDTWCSKHGTDKWNDSTKLLITLMQQ